DPAALPAGLGVGAPAGLGRRVDPRLGPPHAADAARGGGAARAWIGLGRPRRVCGRGPRVRAARSGALGGRLPAAARHGRAIRAARPVVPAGAAARRDAALHPPPLHRTPPLPPPPPPQPPAPS